MEYEKNRVGSGNIGGVYGIQGWLKILSFSRTRGNISKYGSWLVKKNDEGLEMQLLAGKPQGKGLIASLEDITDRNEAMTLVDSELAIDRDSLPAAKEGEFYWHDLINMQVINQQNEVLGVVKELLETGANDVLVVEADTQRYLIP